MRLRELDGRASPLSFFRLIGIGLLAGMLPILASARGLEPGAPAPDFKLKDLQGATVRLSDLRGKGVVLHFWATWCPHCLSEMPLLQKIEAPLRSKGVRILGVNLGEPRRTVERYVREHGLGFPILLDAKGKAAQAFGVTGLPATVVVDREGRILRRIDMGSLEGGELEGLLSGGAGESFP